MVINHRSYQNLASNSFDKEETVSADCHLSRINNVLYREYASARIIRENTDESCMSDGVTLCYCSQRALLKIVSLMDVTEI